MPNVWELVNEITSELSRFTLAGGVGSLTHDDAIDLLNQLSEMEIYLPSTDALEMKVLMREDGIVYEGFDERDSEEKYGMSTVF